MAHERQDLQFCFSSCARAQHQYSVLQWLFFGYFVEHQYKSSLLLNRNSLLPHLSQVTFFPHSWKHVNQFSKFPLPYFPFLPCCSSFLLICSCCFFIFFL